MKLSSVFFCQISPGVNELMGATLCPSRKDGSVFNNFFNLLIPCQLRLMEYSGAVLVVDGSISSIMHICHCRSILYLQMRCL